MNFCLAIATYNRPLELDRCLVSVFGQSILPSRLLIVDDGNLSQEEQEKIKSNCQLKNIVFKYYNKDNLKYRRGLSESKNLALELADEEIIFFLDDDIVLRPEFFKSVMIRWQENKNDKNLIGIGGVINNSRRIGRLEKIYNIIFGLSSSLSWDINNRAFQVWDDYINKLSRGYYAHGGLLSLRKELAKKLGFAVFAGGRTALEDVDFSWRAKRAGKYFLIEPGARADHEHAKTSRESQYLSGQKEGRNRCLIYYQNGPGTVGESLAFAWSHLGWIGKQLLAGHLAKGAGMIRGWLGR